jgi:hypothetical protein
MLYNTTGQNIFKPGSYRRQIDRDNFDPTLLSIDSPFILLFASPTMKFRVRISVDEYH